MVTLTADARPLGDTHVTMSCNIGPAVTTFKEYATDYCKFIDMLASLLHEAPASGRGPG